MHTEKTIEQKTFFVVILTVITMFAEIIAGYITNSMALLADGFHMFTHAFALGLAFLAYFFARKYKDSQIFTNGTEKIKTLAGYTSSLFLLFTGFWIIIESITRFIKPLEIEFSQAILVATIGLIINILCITIMHDEHSDEHDNNYKSAYLHILADILTSVLAIIALIFGTILKVTFLDASVGILGGFVILKWSISLIKNTAKSLLDMDCKKM